MKRKFTMLTGIILVFAVLLAGCGKKQYIKEARELAQEYLDELKVQVSDETIYLTDDEPESYRYLLEFTARSEKYDGEFKINVNTDNSISDSYYALSLKDGASRQFSELLENIFPDACPAFELSVYNVVGVSGKVLNSVQEAQEVLNNSIGLINVVIMPSESDGISDETLDELLKAMQKAGFYGDLSISDDVRVFHISGTEINYTRTDDGPGEVRYYNLTPD